VRVLRSVYSVGFQNMLSNSPCCLVRIIQRDVSVCSRKLLRTITQRMDHPGRPSLRFGLGGSIWSINLLICALTKLFRSGRSVLGGFINALRCGTPLTMAINGPSIFKTCERQASPEVGYFLRNHANTCFEVIGP
jgi:hypothetical protein